MKLKLPSGKDVLFTVTHFLEPIRRRGKQQLHRATTVRIILPDLQSIKGTSVCSLNDQFCRAKGRTIAFERLLETETAKIHLTKEDIRLLEEKVHPFKEKPKAEKKKFTQEEIDALKQKAKK